MKHSLPLSLALAALIVLGGCGEGGLDTPFFSDPDIRSSTATELDSLVADGSWVSISGKVIEQYEGELLVDDGTGLIQVALPEDPPLLTGQWLFAAGSLTERDGLPLLQASEWLYDSTAVTVHSD